MLTDRSKLLRENSSQAVCLVCNRPLTDEILSIERVKADLNIEDCNKRVVEANNEEEIAEQRRSALIRNRESLDNSINQKNRQIDSNAAAIEGSEKEAKEASDRIVSSIEQLTSVEGFVVSHVPPTAEYVKSLCLEATALKDDKSYWEKLAEARKGIGNSSGLEHQITAARNNLPNGWPQDSSEKALSHLTTERQAAQSMQYSASKRKEEAHDGSLKLDGVWKQYNKTKANMESIAKEERAYKLLSECVGEKALQHHLRAEAEKSIVFYANAILQRLSLGSLYVERNAESGEVLDLRIRDVEKSQEWLKAQALSGSQKFRLAVALALGIGQYACKNGTGGIESVIIDEGFGSLDKENREQMIEELHRLGSLLKRVILVSHQEEFSDAFPDQWHITFSNGTAVATTFSPD